MKRINVHEAKTHLSKYLEHVERTERDRHGVDNLPLDEESTLHLTRLPALHRDPFDRMLICQAIAHGLVIVTPDRDVGQYPLRTLW